MKNKGPRAKVITDFAIDYLDKYRFTTKSNYANYEEEVAENRESRLKELYKIISSLNKQISHTQREYNQAKAIVLDPDHEMREHFSNSDLKEYKTELKRLKDAFKIAKAEQERLKTVFPTYEKYLELFDNVAFLLRSTKSITVFNKILEKFISNLFVEGEIYGPKMVNTRWKVVDIKLKEPYEEFLQSQNFEHGRVGAINLEQLDVLLNSLKTYWDYTNQKSLLAEIKTSPAVASEAEKVLEYEL